MRRKRRIADAPRLPPPGMMFFYWDTIPIALVERRSKAAMAGFDELPRHERDRINNDLSPGDKTVSRGRR